MNRAKRQRGATLLEAIIAMLLLVTGMAAIFAMVTRVSKANHSLTFQTKALDAFATIAAQVRDAQCDMLVNPLPPLAAGQHIEDPGLVPAGWQTAPVPGSVIQFVGETNGTAPNLPYTVPPMRIEYQSTANNLGTGPDAYMVDVRITELTGDAVYDNSTNRRLQVYPIKKVCHFRSDAEGRGYVN